MNELLQSVPDMSGNHCVRAISSQMGQVPGVGDVEVQPATRTVPVIGAATEAAAREAIAKAGYEAA